MTTLSHSVTIASEGDLADWQRFAGERAPSNPMLDAAWYRVLADAFSVERLFLMCRDGAGQLAGLAPLYLSRSPITGRHLTNLEDGWYAADDAASRALLHEAMSVTASRGAHYLLLRNAGSVADAASHIVTTVRRVIDTSRGAESILREVKKKNRWCIRQAVANGFVAVEDSRLQRIDLFYDLYARRMRDLGTPVMSIEYMRALGRRFGPARLRLFFVCRDGREIGGMLCLAAADSWLNMYAVVREDMMAQYANYLLYWHAIERAAAAGIARFDLGRSRPASNTYFFKSKWPGTDREVPHGCYCAPRMSGRVGHIGEQDSIARRIWKRLPLPLANWAGPKIRNQLPFG
jgi:hypothetical protein